MKKATKILVIDDNSDILFAISAICRFQNWIPITAINAKEGIEKFKRELPNLVLIDYHMPRMNGMEAVKELRKICHKVPIVVLTVEERQETADEFIMAGANDFALKPIKAPDLISRIKVHLRMNRNSYNQDKNEPEYIKGINNPTLELITSVLTNTDGFVFIADICENTGLAHQTVHRYLQYLIDIKKIEINLDYGKVGRPKQSYRWIEDKRNTSSISQKNLTNNMFD